MDIKENLGPAKEDLINLKMLLMLDLVLMIIHSKKTKRVLLQFLNLN